MLQGTVRTTLTKLKDSAASRSHELVEEMLSLQETLDTLLHSLTERTEENASLTVDVSTTLSSTLVVKEGGCLRLHMLREHALSQSWT